MSKRIQDNLYKEYLTDEHLLLDYINRRLPEKETQLLESEMARDPFLKDALEGLSVLPDEKQLRGSVLLLQKQLKAHVQSRKKRHKRYLQPKLWLWLSALVLFIIIMAAWRIISLAKFH
ncbi:MAG TPA: hypothetical protein VFL76_01240 [Edaphocola sp.]|nr:hypothetical protein [Edaphocola sp.]